MIIHSLDLENYGIIKKANLIFNEKGFNVFSGSTGQGKSHTIRALNYLLFNYTYGKIEDDCNWDSNFFSAEVKLSHNSNNFKISTFYDRDNGASKELVINNKSITGNNEVKDTLAKYFDPSITKASMVSLQGSMDIVEAGDAERREYLKKIYDLDFKTQIDSIKEDIENVSDKIIKIEKDIYLYENKEYIPTDEKDSNVTEEEYIKCGLEREVLIVKKDNLQQLLDKVDDLLLRITKEENNIKTLQEKKETLENRTTEVQSSLDKVTKESKNSLIKYYADLLKLNKEKDDIVLKRVPAFDEDNLNIKEKEYADNLISFHSAKKEYELTQLGLCPTCKKPFEVTEIETYKNEYETSLERKESSLTVVNSLRNQKKDIDNLQKKQNELKEKKNSLIKDINSLDLLQKSSVTYSDAQVLDKTTILQEKFKEIQLISLEIISKEKDKELLISEKTSIVNKTTDQTDNTDRINELRLVTDTYESIQIENDLIIKANIKLAQQQIDDVKKLQEYTKEKVKLIKTKDEYEVIKEILRVDFPKFVINSMVSDIENGMNKLLDLSYDGRYNCSISESKKGLQILYGDKQKDIKLSSGGEQNLFNLGFKNALTQIAKLKILILDEADNFLSGDIAKRAFESLNQLIENGDIDQIFLISHKEEIRDMIETDFNGKIFHFEEGEVY